MPSLLRAHALAAAVAIGGCSSAYPDVRFPAYSEYDPAAAHPTPAPALIGRELTITASFYTDTCHEDDGMSHDGSGPDEWTAPCHPGAFTAVVTCAGASASACPTGEQRGDKTMTYGLPITIIPTQLGPLRIDVTMHHGDAVFRRGADYVVVGAVLDANMPGTTVEAEHPTLAVQIEPAFAAYDYRTSTVADMTANGRPLATPLLVDLAALFPDRRDGGHGVAPGVYPIDLELGGIRHHVEVTATPATAATPSPSPLPAPPAPGP